MRRLGQKHGPLRSVDGETELSRELSLRPDEAWAHVSNLADLGDWLQMHQGWRSDLPDELAVGTTLVGVAGAKGMRNRSPGRFDSSIRPSGSKSPATASAARSTRSR
jgi:hypothetical protein